MRAIGLRLRFAPDRSSRTWPNRPSCPCAVFRDHCSVFGPDTVACGIPCVGTPLTLAAVTAAHSRQIGMPGQSTCAGVCIPRPARQRAHQCVVESGMGVGSFRRRSILDSDAMHTSCGDQSAECRSGVRSVKRSDLRRVGAQRVDLVEHPLK
jgi:hypothetical protein